MSRKKKHAEHENHERWLVSYADFITLLFAFFTVLYATAQTDQQKIKAVVDGMNAVFDGGMPDALLDMMSTESNETIEIQPNHLAQEAAEPLIRTLKRNLQGSLSDNVVQIGLIDQDLTLVLPRRLMFSKGSAELHPSAYGILVKVVAVLKNAPATLTVVGYADGVPVSKGGKWVDNWHLATARSLATVRYLVRKGYPVSKITVAASITPHADQEARAVDLKIRVLEPGPSAEVEQALRDPLDQR